MTDETFARAPREPIGRILSVVVLGNTDRDHPIEDEIAGAVHEAGERHGLDVMTASGPYYSDGDEQTRELAKVTADRDRMAEMYEAATLVLALHLNANCSTVQQVRARAAAADSAPAREDASEAHEPFTDDGATYCGWTGDEGTVGGCGHAWPCPTVRARNNA